MVYKRKIRSKSSEKKYLTLSDKSLTILNEWLENNIQNPYPSTEIKKHLSKKAKIKIRRLNKWLENQRYQIKTKKLRKVSRSAFKNRILEDFFKRNERPTKIQKNELAVLTDKSYEQITKWFCYKRFEKSHKRQQIHLCF